MNQTNNNGDEKLLLKLPTWKIWYVMAVIYVLLFIDFGARVIISPLFPLIKKEFDLSDSQLGLLSTIVLAAVCVLALPLSYIIDRWRRGKMISIIAIIWSIGSIFTGIANSFGTLLASRAIVGVGEASYNSAGQTMIMAMIKKKLRTTVTGIWTTAASLGMAAGMLLGGWVGTTYGWRAAFMVIGIPGIIFGILAWFMPDYKNHPKDAPQQRIGFGGMMKQFAANKSLVTLVIATALVTFLTYTVASWLPTYLVRYANMSIATAGLVSGGVLLTAIIAGPFGGWIGDLAARKKLKNKIIVMLCSAFLAFASFACALLFNFWPLFFLTSFGINAIIPCIQVSLQELVPMHQRASVFGFYFAALFILGGLWAPLVVGAISDATNLKTAFWISSGITFIGVILYPLIFKFFDNDYARARQQEQDIV